MKKKLSQAFCFMLKIKLFTPKVAQNKMQLLQWFLLMFMVMSVSFSFSEAIDCRLNQNDVAKVAYTITVDKSGHGNFLTIQEAVDHIPSNNDQWIRIHANPGIYTEKVTIPEDKPCILLEGSGYSQTTITWNDHGRTDTSATFTVSPDNFVAKGIAFKNSYNLLVQQTAEDDNAWTQALAVRIYGDKSAFHQCAFMGFQDTIWDVKGRHYFNSCYIEGAVDFIWGSGQSLYEDCSINSTAGRLGPQVSAGFITAQGRQSPDDPSGFVFSGGSISGTGKSYLGRAYGPYSRVVFHGTTLGAVVVPEGWDAWKFQGQEGRFTYAEIDCKGAGADTSKRVGWERKSLSGSELQQYLGSNFINQDEWLPTQP